MLESQFRSHPLHALLDTLDSQLNTGTFQDPSILAEEAIRTSIESAVAAVAIVRSLMLRTPPLLISTAGLASINGAFTEVNRLLTQFQSDRTAGHLTNALVQVEQTILPSLWTFAPSVINGDPAILGDAFQHVLEQASHAVTQSATQVKILSDQVSELKGQLSEASNRMGVISEEITTQKAHNAAAVAEIKQQYAESETARVTQFSTGQDERQRQFNTLLEGAINEQKTALVKLDIAVKESAKLVGLTAKNATSGHYSKLAESEGVKADQLRNATLGLFGAGILAALINFIHLFLEPMTATNAWTIIARFLLAIVFALPAFYTARESARHRTTADRARQRELELAALDPFIESMPVDMKNEIRKEQTQRMFGKEVQDHIVETPVDAKSILEGATKIIEAVKKS